MVAVMGVVMQLLCIVAFHPIRTKRTFIVRCFAVMVVQLGIHSPLPSGQAHPRYG